VSRRALSEVIDGRLISGGSGIVPTDDEPVLAVDVLGCFAAVYRFSVDHGGAWFADCTVALRIAEGTWRDAGSGGTRGAGWKVPWRPSRETLDDRAIAIFGSIGRDLADEQDRPVFVRAIYGFVDPTVRSLHLSAASGERAVEVESPAGAFAVVVLGESAVELQGLGETGADVGQSATAAPV
jgi:hypothetical protein